LIQLSEFNPTGENVGKIINMFKRKELPRLNRLWDYYDGKNKILNRTMQSGKPNNKTVHEYCKYITDTVSGYFLGNNVKYSSDNKEYLQKYSEIIEDNFEEDENFELAKKASIFGYAVELLYQNENALTRFKRDDPRNVILIFGTNINSFIIAAIRYYTENDLEGKKVEIAEVYTENEIIEFRKLKNKFKEESRYNHYFGEVPVILYKNNEEMKGDFEGVISLVDGYDKSQSDSANDFEYFTDAYLIISGYGGLDLEDDAEDGEEDAREEAYKNMREKRVMFFEEKGEAKFLIKEINDTATENYKNRLNADIHKFSMTPDMTDEKFAGNLSGIAIQFKTLPLEQRTKMKENKFRTGFKKRRELITNIMNIKHGTSYDYREIKEEFTRNLPQNDKDETERILMQADHISERTLLELLPDIKDVDQEIERLKKEREDDDNDEYDNFKQEEIIHESEIE
jgi:SPP1 family phage portal protein